MARRRKEEEHENHERWLVSYADFITLLFAFFVVMYAISTLNVGKYRVLADSLIVAFRNDVVVTAQTNGLAPINRTTSSAPQRPTIVATDPMRRQRAEKMVALASRITEAMKPLVQTGQVRLTQLPHGLAVEINASLLFAPAQASLQPESIAALEAMAKLLLDTTQQVRVEGHTDNIPIASAVYPSNWELSSARAASVVRLFASTGVDASRLSVVGFADNRPVESNGSFEGRARNRRVTLLILDDLTTKPAVEAQNSASTSVPVSDVQNVSGAPAERVSAQPEEEPGVAVPQATP